MDDAGLLARFATMLRTVWRRFSVAPRHGNIEAALRQKSSDPRYLRARAFLRAGYPDLMHAVYQGASHTDSGLSHAIELQGEALERGGLRVAAMERHEAVFQLRNDRLSDAPDRTGDLMLRAKALARGGFDQQALRLYADVQALDPTRHDAAEAQGEFLDRMGESARAAEMYLTARRARAAIQSGLPDRHFVHRQRGHFNVEIAAYDSVVRSLKKKSLPYVARGNAYLASARPDKALADYERAIRLKPKAWEIKALQGEALSMLGRYSDALQIFNDVLAAHPGDREVLSCRAVARIALGRVEQANDDWQRQFELLPEDHAAARACVALRMANYSAALPELEAALARQPADPYWLLYRLTAQRRLGVKFMIAESNSAGAWPAPLFALHAGLITETQLLQSADSPGRLVEAYFQIAVATIDRDRTAAAGYLQRLIETFAPSLVEFAAARNELSRFGS